MPSLPFNPDILRWARNRADYTQSEVAEKIKVPTRKIAEWENQSSSPTVIQARKMAELYGRPFLEFFATAIPNIIETKLVPDFRMQRDYHVNHENKMLRDVQSWGETQRLNALDLFEINGEGLPLFPKELRVRLDTDPETVAHTARITLNFDISEQLNLKSSEKGNLVKILRTKLESAGVLILKNSDLAKCNARGLCIYNEVLPIVILSNESATGSSFTLCHELGHIILQQSAVSDGSIQKKANANLLENWCNHFAGAFLIPQTTLFRYVELKEKRLDISDNELTTLAKRFAVSRHAMLVRLVQLDLVAADYYWKVKRPQFLEEESKKPLGGPPPYYGVRYRNRNGDMYTGLVLEAWSNNLISNHNAAEFMGIKNLNHLFDIRNHFNDR